MSGSKEQIDVRLVVEAISSSSAAENVVIDVPLYVVESRCMCCGDNGVTSLLTLIPHFRKLKPGGRIPEKGKRIRLHVKNLDDLSRDVIKSDTASVRVPKLDLELACGTLGGIVTTVEGLITKISESLERVHGFTFGDSLDDDKKSRWKDFIARLSKE